MIKNHEEKQYFRSGREVNNKTISKELQMLKKYYGVNIQTRINSKNLDTYSLQSLDEYLIRINDAKKKLKKDLENKIISKESYEDAINTIDVIVNWKIKNPIYNFSKTNIDKNGKNENLSKVRMLPSSPQTMREKFALIVFEIEDALNIHISSEKILHYIENGQQKVFRFQKTIEEQNNEETIAFNKLNKKFKNGEISQEEKINLENKLSFAFSYVKKSAIKKRNQKTKEHINNILILQEETKLKEKSF